MINIFVSVIFFLGGFYLLFRSKKRHNIYLAIGFILYGLQYLLSNYIIQGNITEVLFNIPRVLASLSLMMSPITYLRGGK